MEKRKDIGWMLGFTAFFGLLAGILIHAYIEEYNLTNLTQQEATVTTKVSENSIHLPPTYYVRVKLADGEEPDYLNRVPKWTFDHLQEGDTVKGYVTFKGGPFHTVGDIVESSVFYLIGIGIFGLFALLGVLVMLFEIPAIDRLTSRKKRHKKKKKGSGLGVLYVCLGVFAFFSVRFLYNLFHKLMPFGKEKGEATIIDSYQYTSYRVNEDSEYTFTIRFNDQDGQPIETVKEVTRGLFDRHDIGDTLAITYRERNPYDVFVDANFSDMVQTLFYGETLIYVMFIVLIIVSVPAAYRWKKKHS